MYGHVSKHVWTRVWSMCVDICADMCIDLCIDLFMGMCTGISADSCKGIQCKYRDMYGQMYRHLRQCLRGTLCGCVDFCMEIRLDVSLQRAEIWCRCMHGWADGRRHVSRQARRVCRSGQSSILLRGRKRPETQWTVRSQHVWAITILAKIILAIAIWAITNLVTEASETQSTMDGL